MNDKSKMVNEEIKKYVDYFRYKSRDSYYVIMKVEAAKRLKENTDFSLKKIAQIILKDKDRHDAIIHYLRKYKKPSDYDTFINENFERFISENIYPISVQHNTYRKPVYYFEEVAGNGMVKESFTTYKEVKKEDLLIK